MRITALIALGLFCAAAAYAQDGDVGAPLDVGEITVTGTRVIKLPPARKGEVVDSSVYALPAGDTLLFGERISNFGGPGGALPGYREFDRPTSAHAEASIGTYLSPWLRAHGEYNGRSFDVMGTVDYRATAGHVDSAEASSLGLDLRGGVLLGGDDPNAPRVRITAGVDRIGDGYYLYGNSVERLERTRSAMRVNARLNSAQDALLDYDIYFRLERSDVDDLDGDSTLTASAATPGFGLTLAAGNDTLRGRLGIDYQISSLQYGGPSKTPNWVTARVEGEWHVDPRLLLMAGVMYGGGQYSDSGTITMLLPRVSARFQASPSLSLFAWYAPELRAPSYRNRIMRAPYVDRRIVLRPERVPINVAAGARLSGESITVDGRVVFESADNTPVVAADSAGRGALRYAHVDSRTLGLHASVQTQVGPSLALLGEAHVRSAVDVETDEQLPMVAQIEALLRGDYRISNALGLFSSLRYESAQNVTLGESPRTIPSRILLDAGGSYQLSTGVGLFVEVTNILGSSYELWDGYDAPGIEARAGARVMF